MTIEEVKADLREIRYYYAHAKEFEGATKIIGKNSIEEKTEKYNAAIRKAPSRLYYIYLSLYIHFNTQTVAALDMDYSVGHVKRLNRELCEFFAREIGNE